MEFSLKAETVNFFLSILLGMIFGMAYDIFRIIRLTVKHKTRIIFIEDILYFTVIAFLSFLFSLIFTRGIVRAYQLIGQLGGFIIYHFTLGEAMLYFADGIINLAKLIFAIIMKLLINPIIFMLKFILKILSKPILLLWTLLKKGIKKIKYGLKKIGVLLYNQKESKNKKDTVA